MVIDRRRMAILCMDLDIDNSHDGIMITNLLYFRVIDNITGYESFSQLLADMNIIILPGDVGLRMTDSLHMPTMELCGAIDQVEIL